MHIINMYITQERANIKCCSKVHVTHLITVLKYATVNKLVHYSLL